MDAKLTFLFDRIKEELEDAEEYLEHAIKCRQHPEMSSMFQKLSADEMQHAQMLQAHAMQKVAAMGDDYAAAVHDWLKGHWMEHTVKIKHMQDALTSK